MHTLYAVRWLVGLCLASCMAAAACSDGETPAEASPDAGMVPSTAEPQSELEKIVTQVVASYDQQVEANCPCFVAMGAYPSVEECVRWQRSREDWVPCLSGVLAKHESEATFEAFRCYVNIMRETQLCLGDKRCDPEQRAMCERSALECVGSQLDVVLEASAMCPDVGLLTRQ